MAGPDNNDGARDLTAELNEVLARSKNDKLKTEAAYIKAWIASDPFDRKDLYARYHDKGVEFIGVSLDYSPEEGGLDRLKAFVTKNEIPWSQYYQGHGWESDFSQHLGIDSTPAVFLVDQNGKLVSLDAGGKLETLILELTQRNNR